MTSMMMPRIVLGREQHRAACGREVLHRLRHEGLVGRNGRNRRIGEDGDRIGGGDVLDLQVLERQAGLLQFHLQQQPRRNVGLGRHGLALEIG